MTVRRCVLVALASLTLAAIPPGSQAAAPPPAKQIVALKRQVAALQSKNATLNSRVSSLKLERDSLKGQVAALIAERAAQPQPPSLPTMVGALDARQLFLTILPVVKQVFDQEKAATPLEPFSASFFDGSSYKSYSFDCFGFYSGAVCSP